MNIWRAFRYLFGARARNDLASLARHRGQACPDILFVAGSQVDLQWVMPAYEGATARGLKCAFAGPDLVVPPHAPYMNISVHMLRFIRTRIMVTATSGLTRAQMPNCGRRVAVPHSLVSLHMVYPAGTFDGYTDVFCCGVHHQSEIDAMNLKDGLAGRRRSVLIGYAKFESLVAIRPADGPASGAGKHVLIGPSWGPGNILETMGTALLDYLLGNGYKVTLRPHPSFFINGDTQIAALIDRWMSHPAFALESSLEESHALWTADMMIADYSGFAMEFAFVRERPVLYMDVPPKVLNPRWREVGLTPLELSIRERIGVVAPPSLDSIITGLEQLNKESDLWPERIRQERTRNWVNFGNFGFCCAEELACMLAEMSAMSEESSRKPS